MKQRHQDIERLYRALNRLPTRIMRDCNGRLPWPDRGVYFFFEPGEVHEATGQSRIVRVGTHAVSKGARTKLWSRLSQHRGTQAGRGNHRGSIFRLLVGAALLDRDSNLTDLGTWGDKSSTKRELRRHEQEVETAVSAYIGTMPFSWIAVNDEPDKRSKRAAIERNAIALLSRVNGNSHHPSAQWLGHHCPRVAVRDSGLWNIRHTADEYDREFLNLLEQAVEDTMAAQ